MRDALPLMLALLGCSPAPQTFEARPQPPPPAAVAGEEQMCGGWGVSGPCYNAPNAEFGAQPMGATYAAVPSDAVAIHGDCATSGEFDCEFVDADGVHYLLFGDFLARKRVVLNAPNLRLLPYGLTGRETPEEALAMLGAQFAFPFELTVRDDGARLVSNVGTLKNPQGHAFWLVLVFTSDGALEEIVLQGPPTV